MYSYHLSFGPFNNASIYNLKVAVGVKVLFHLLQLKMMPTLTMETWMLVHFAVFFVSYI